MRYFNLILPLIILLVTIKFSVSCRQNLQSNEFNIYVSEDNPGWHFVDLNYDTINKGYHKIVVKFDKGQIFQTALIRSNLKNYQPIFLYHNNDTVKTGLWFLGEYNYDIERKFISFYMPTEIQRKTIRDYMKDPSYDSLRSEMNILVENYLRER